VFDDEVGLELKAYSSSQAALLSCFSRSLSGKYGSARRENPFSSIEKWGFRRGEIV
jgi:hypothetical protein